MNIVWKYKIHKVTEGESNSKHESNTAHIMKDSLTELSAICGGSKLSSHAA